MLLFYMGFLCSNEHLFVRITERVSDVMLSYFDFVVGEGDEAMYANVESSLKCSALCAREVAFKCNCFELEKHDKLCLISSKPSNKWSNSFKYRIKMGELFVSNYFAQM